MLPEYVLPPVDEESIGAAAFDLLSAFDEVISLGYKENVTVGQVKQNTEMESHEEKLHKMIIASKVSDTKVGLPTLCLLHWLTCSRLPIAPMPTLQQVLTASLLLCLLAVQCVPALCMQSSVVM